MKKRSPGAVFILSLVTFGIYSIVWQVKTKNELNSLGAKIPTAWLIIVPLANLYWIWKYAEGVEQVSKGEVSAIMVLILLLLLSIVGMAILQSEFNSKIVGQSAAAAPSGAAAAPQPVADAAPAAPAEPPADKPDEGSTPPPADPPAAV